MLNSMRCLASRPRGLRCGSGAALVVLAVLMFSAGDASAAALASITTSVGLIAALTAMVAVKAWAANPIFNSISTAGGVVALSAGALVLWRVMRGAAPVPRGWVSGGTPRDVRRNKADMTGGTKPVLDLPAGLDTHELTRVLCDHFRRVQEAWDAGDAEVLAGLTTPRMLDELQVQACEYAGCAGRTDVVSLQATLLGYEQRETAELVCVEFTGLLQDASHAAPGPFRELWLLERSKSQSAAWKLARQQTLL